MARRSCTVAVPAALTLSPITRAPAMALIAAVLFNASTPAFTVVVPEKVLADAPLNVKVPEPFIVRPPVPLTTPLKVIFPAPVSVRRKPPLVKAPLRVNVPASDAIVVAEPSVTEPLMLLLPLMLRMAPSFETPLPFRVSASAPTAMPPWI